MREGYFYFIPAMGEGREENKALGYISISNAPAKSAYSVQCSLNQNLIKIRGNFEIYFSSVPHADTQSVFAGKIRSASGGSRLFMDTYISYSDIQGLDGDIYAVVSHGGRTLCYSIINKEITEDAYKASSSMTPEQTSAAASPPAPVPASAFAPIRSEPEKEDPKASGASPLFSGRIFDPFVTTNKSYKWYIYDVFNNTNNSTNSVGNIQWLDKLLKYYNINYSMFAHINSTIGNSAFLKMAYYSVQLAGHLIRGEYTDPNTGRAFTIIGLPGWNSMNNGRYTKQNARHARMSHNISGAAAIRECSRWIPAVNKPRFAYNRSYNGYWLYYFDAESGLPVKAVMKVQEQ